MSVAALIAASMLAACSGGEMTRAPVAESRTPAQLSPRFYPPEGWAWGWLQVGDAPPQRYGVSAPSGTPRAQILILPDYGESAETWFETARDLNDLGYAVWVLDGVGQGGSGRAPGPSDRGQLRSFEPDAAAVRAMDKVVVRPTERSPLVLLGHGVGGLIAVRSVETGERPAALILSAPVLDKGAGAPDRAGWRRDLRYDIALARTHDPWRGAATHAWQVENPDLRMGGPTPDWLGAFDRDSARTLAGLGGVFVPTLVIEGDDAAGCRRLPRCEAQRLAGGGRALELERDPVRDAWLAAVDQVLRRLRG